MRPADAIDARLQPLVQRLASHISPDAAPQSSADLMQLGVAAELATQEMEALHYVISVGRGSALLSHLLGSRQVRAPDDAHDGISLFTVFRGTPRDDVPDLKQIIKAAKDLRQSWPRDHEGEADPAAFARIAARLDATKAEALAAAGEPPEPALLREVMERADVIHGKAGQTANVESLVSALMLDDVAREQLEGLDGWTSHTAVDAVAAAPWINLGELEVPVRILAAPRKLSDAEFVEYIKPRAKNSAALYRKARIDDSERVGDIIEQFKGGTDRPLASIILDLADQVAAMGAKPFFRNEDNSKVDAEKLKGAVQKNAEAASIPSKVVAVFADAIESGLVDSALTRARESDLYVK